MIAAFRIGDPRGEYPSRSEDGVWAFSERWHDADASVFGETRDLLSRLNCGWEIILLAPPTQKINVDLISGWVNPSHKTRAC